eukprot:275770_1
MEVTFWTVVIVICLLAALYELYWALRIKIRKLPPGPPRLMQYVYWFVFKMLFKTGYTKAFDLNRFYQRKYGGIRYSSFGGMQTVVIYSSKLAKQILSHKNALNRPIFGHELNIESTSDGTAPFANINGKEWEKRRKFSQSILFRMCTSTFVGKILDETLTNVVFKKLNKICAENKLWYPSSLMKYTAFNTIFYANYGKHISYDNPLYHSLVAVITETFRLFASGIMLSMSPKWILFIFKLFPNSTYYKILDLVKRRDEIYQEFDSKYFNQNKNDKHESKYYVDYINNKLTKSEVYADAGSLFAAGTDTTSSTLNFGVVFCAKYRDIQEKVRRELMDCYHKNKNESDEIIDDNIVRFNINWINQLTYFRAFIYEIIRVSSITMIGLPHYAANDIYVNSDNKRYCIPKGCVILYMTEVMHKYTENRENWVNSSNEMCLENWINKNTKKFEINQSFMTFGSGRRDCVGRNFALKQLYIIMAYLLLNYKFSFKNQSDKEKEIKTMFNGVNVIDPPIGVVVEHL